MPPYLEAPNLKEFPNLKHAFTTKLIHTDYDRVAQKLKVLGSQIYYMEQVHSGAVNFFGDGMNLKDLQPGDALVTNRKDIYIGVRTADCVPVLVFEPEQEVVAAIHAGYNGLLKGIIPNTIKMMVESLKCDPAKMYAAIGPSISVENYEVAPDLIHEFESVLGRRFAFSTEYGERPHLDCKQTAFMALQDQGLDDLHIQDMNLCTHKESDLFFSYRRDGGAGRQFNCIGMMS